MRYDHYFQNSSDKEIQEKILQSFYELPEIDLTEISVLVRSGDVYLSGRVSSHVIKKKIVSEIEKFPGVSKVFDELVVIKKSKHIGQLRTFFKDLGI
jgi:osmotically-inducible protein OsmY